MSWGKEGNNKYYNKQVEQPPSTPFLPLGHQLVSVSASLKGFSRDFRHLTSTKTQSHLTGFEID